MALERSEDTMTPNRDSFRALFSTIVNVGLVVLSVAPAVAQSLGAVARDEAARRKTTPAGKVYTNANLPAEAVSPAAAPASSGTSRGIS